MYLSSTKNSVSYATMTCRRRLLLYLYPVIIIFVFRGALFSQISLRPRGAAADNRAAAQWYVSKNWPMYCPSQPTNKLTGRRHQPSRYASWADV
jgi:hypothetical protein